MQLEFQNDIAAYENPDYLKRQLITYLGNKRSLLPEIEETVLAARTSLGGRRLRACDVFAGSGVVSRMLKQHSELLISNDFEPYAACIARAYLSNSSEVNLSELGEIIQKLNGLVDGNEGPSGFIREMYAPLDDTDIKPGERVFYSSENARRLDAYAQLIREERPEVQDLLMAPLLSAASIHANTGGVFKGFYKDKNGNGCFGGSGRDALQRILNPIRLELPVLSNFESECIVYQQDAADLPSSLPELDYVYLDPPYNQHPYGSNYFMLNHVYKYERPVNVSEVSGIPTDWQRSDYNKKSASLAALTKLVESLPSRYIVLSFSNDGFLHPDALFDLFSRFGKAKISNIDYKTYRASRNLRNRDLQITEHLFVLDRG